MANKNAPGAGRPALPETPKNATPAESAVALLQYATDRACAFVADAYQTSMVARAGRCARAGVPAATVEKAFAAVEAAIADGRTAAAAAYAAPAAKVATKSRVTL